MLFQVTEWAGLIVVMHLCIFRFLETTTFRFPFDSTFRRITLAALIGLGALRLLICTGRDIRPASTKKEKEAVILKAIAMIALSAPCFIIAIRFGYKQFVYIPFAALCLYGTDTDKILKAFTICIGTMLAVTILNALSGSIENILYLGGRKGRLRGSYGVGYPTDFASYFIFLFLFFWASQKRRDIGHTAVVFGLALLMTYGIHTYPRSDTSTICGIVIALAVLYDWLHERVISRHEGTKWITKIVDLFTIGAFPLFGIGVYSLTWLYGHGNSFAVQLDKWMSNRIHLTWDSYIKYGIHAFGALTPQNGAGGSLIHTETYEFLDSSYGLLLIRYGCVFTLIVAVLWVWMTRKAIKTGHRRLALAMAIIAFHSISEHHFPEINYNILLVMPLCHFALIRQSEEKRIITKETLAGWLAGLAVALPCIFLLPGMLSRTRALFAIREWTGGGEKVLGALFYWLIWFAIAIFAWILLRRLLKQILMKQPKDKKIYRPILAGLLAMILAGTAGFVWINRQVSDGMQAYDSQITADTAAVETVLNTAEEPVYAGQTEEFYKRAFSGFSDRILSPEEICRNGRGSLFLEHDNEGYQLINTGALYTEISPYTGLFTYDDAVIEALEAKGYRFHGYFSAERQVDLAKEARRNGLEQTENGLLILQGEGHSIISGPDLDQFKGTYTVTFDLQLTEEEQPKHTTGEEIATLLVSEQLGKIIRSEQVIHAGDFSPEGKLTASLNYKVGSTRGVEYLVICRDNTELLVDQIAWRSNPDTDIRREYTEEGRIQRERYFTEEGEPFEQTAGYYGKGYEYDSWGNVVYIQYFDRMDQPIRTTNGYAAIEYAYDDAGNRILERYLDENGKPVLVSEGYAELHREFNSDHQVIKETYYDENGNPVTLAQGQEL